MQPEKASTTQQRTLPVLPRDAAAVITEQQLAQIKAVYPQVVRDLAKFREVATIKTFAPCQAQSDEYVCVPITIFQWRETPGSDPYCVGLIPEEVKLSGTNPGNGAKMIAWQLGLRDPSIPVDPPDSYFEFLGDEDQGILVFKNIGNGATQQLKDGKRHPSTNSRYRIKDQHNKTGTASYLPVVVHVVPSNNPAVDDKVGLCGTPDPRIVNE